MVNFFFKPIEKALAKYGALVIASRHLLVSCVCGLSEYFLFMLLYSWIGLALVSCYVTAFVTATLIGYLGHNFYTFQLCKFSIRSSCLFALQAMLVFVVGMYLLKFFVYVGINMWFAKAIQLFSTFSINLFFGRLYSFKKV